MAYERMHRLRLNRGGIEVEWVLPLGSSAPLIVRRLNGVRFQEWEVGPNDFLDVQEAAVALNEADRTTVYRLIREGRLAARMIRGKIAIPRHSLEKYLIQAMEQRRGRRLGEKWKTR
jgi:excisionase family DNA binding protein